MARRDIEAWYWQLERSLSRLTEPIAKAIPPVAARRCWQPHVDLTEDREGLVLTAELAGVRPEHVQIYYLPDRNTVLIRGFRDEPCGGKERVGIYQLEVLYGQFEREIRLPDVPVDFERMTASWDAGMLRVTLPKARHRMNRTRVTIRRV